jgi:hypothetical protein
MLCGLCAIASANPVMGTVVSGGVSVSLPPHWVIQVDASAGQVVAREDPKRKDAAVLTVAITQATATARADALIQALLAVAKDVKIIGRDVVPNTNGLAVAAEGTIDGTHAKLGAIAIVAGGKAAVGLLAAKPDEFDQLGGVPMLLASLQSLHAATPFESDTETKFGRGTKRNDQPDLDPDRAAVPREQLLRPWTHTTVNIGFAERDPSDVTRTRTTNTGDSETYTLAKDGSYKLQTLTHVTLNSCTSVGIGVETGAYTEDGKLLVLTPKSSTLTAKLCGGNTQVEHRKLTPARRYQIGLAGDGRLIFVGPGCTSLAVEQCSDHARWEMTIGT